MSVSNATKRRHEWEQLLVRGSYTSLVGQLQDAPSVEAADFLAQQKRSICVQLLQLFDKSIRAELFSHFSDTHQLLVYQDLSPVGRAEIFSHMPSAARVDFYQHLGEKAQAQLLPFLKKKVREEVIALSAYPTDTAGGIMNTDFVTLRHDMRVRDALDQVREDAPSKKMMYYLYVVDDDMKLQGFVSLKDLLSSEPEDKIASLLRENFACTQVDEDRESVARKIERYQVVALPVLNHEEQLVGIVSHDDALDVIRAEQTEDMEKFMGIVSPEQAEDYLNTSSWKHFKRRIGWLSGLFVASFFSAYLMPRYGKILEIFPVMAFYMTTINDTGGNAGSQAAMVVIRALSLGQLTLRHWAAVLWKEAQVSLLCVLCLAILSFVRIMVVTPTSYTIPGENIYTLAFIVSLALSLQVLVATLVGCTLPLLVKAWGGDPALAASPAITTIVDITGMLIYFTVAMAWVG